MDKDSMKGVTMPQTGAVRPRNSGSENERITNTPKTAQLPDNKQKIATWEEK
jgi:hypothetical protein